MDATALGLSLAGLIVGVVFVVQGYRNPPPPVENLKTGEMYQKRSMLKAFGWLTIAGSAGLVIVQLSV